MKVVTVGLSIVVALAISAGGWYARDEWHSRTYREAAIDFWGKDYTPDAPPLPSTGYRQDKLTPHGGPVILSSVVIEACPDTELAYLPYRLPRPDAVDLLCLSGGAARVTSVDVQKLLSGNRLSESDRNVLMQQFHDMKVQVVKKSVMDRLGKLTSIFSD